MSAFGLNSRWGSDWTIDQTRDEFGNPKFFVSDPNGDWVGEGHPTFELAAKERDELIQKAIEE